MLSTAELTQYHRDGVLTRTRVFDPAETRALRAAFERDATIPGDHRIGEPQGDGVRAVYASHSRQDEFASLIRSPRLLGPARQLVGNDVYLYQLKINSKPAFGGESWAWHQDFPAWRIADNLRSPRLANVAVFLDDVDEFNGPIVFVPGSHRDGLLREDRNAEALSAQHLDPDDIALSGADMARLVDRFGMVSPKGPAGSVVFFHPQVVHGSATNMSPFPRRLLIATYNDVDNVPRPLGAPRPEYLVSRDSAPLQETTDLALTATS